MAYVVKGEGHVREEGEAERKSGQQTLKSWMYILVMLLLGGSSLSNPDTDTSPSAQLEFPEGARLAVLGEISSNLEALEAVHADAIREGATHFLVCGDVVGYGASPNEVVSRVREMASFVLQGDVDAAVIGGSGSLAAAEKTSEALSWTRSNISSESIQYLSTLPGQLEFWGGLKAVHGSLEGQTGEVESLEEGKATFARLAESSPEVETLFMAQSHRALYLGPRAELVQDTGTVKIVKLRAGKRYLVNPGSVGQPRDRDWRASYALYDPQKRVLEFRRVEYEVAKAQEKILESKQAPTNALRLQFGI